jgi:hypothetical protein
MWWLSAYLSASIRLPPIFFALLALEHACISSEGCYLLLIIIRYSHHSYYGESGEYSFTLGTDRSVFQAEVFAIAKAAEHITEQSTTHRRFTFYIDSQAAIKAIISLAPKKNYLLLSTYWITRRHGRGRTYCLLQ